MRYILSTTLLCIAVGSSLLADCLGCLKTHVEYHPSGEHQEVYIKKCIAKQKDIEGHRCEFCHCLRSDHSIHRHQYKMHENRKLKTQPLDLAIKNKRAMPTTSPSVKK